jgi:hypothetical protein
MDAKIAESRMMPDETVGLSAAELQAEQVKPPKTRGSKISIWKDKRLIIVIGLAGLTLACIFVLLFLFNPAQHRFYPVCALHQMTGLNCPGCGSSRAMHQLLHGNILAAFHLNALLVASFPLGLSYLGRAYLRMLRAQPLPFEIKNSWVWLGGAAILSFAILRNLPFEIFASLRP